MSAFSALRRDPGTYMTDGRMLTSQRRETALPRRQTGQEELRAVIVVVVVADGKTGGPGPGGGGLCVSGLDALSLSLSVWIAGRWARVEWRSSGILGYGTGGQDRTRNELIDIELCWDNAG
jgi:hypothetical protein